LSVGRLEPLKGFERLVEALGLLRRSDLRLLIAGGDTHSRTETEKLRLLATDLGVGGCVEFLGAVSQECLPLYYNAADATVVASYYESFCLVILEALACGTPVVSTKVGIAPVVLNGANGRVVTEGTPWELAQALAQTLAERRDTEVRHLMRATTATYSWAVVAGDVATVYERALLLPSAS